MTTIESYFTMFESPSEKEIVVYTDGSCRNNGRPNAEAGLGVFFKDEDPRNTCRRITGKQTNNTAELSAIMEAYTILQEDIEKGTRVLICSDSKYAIWCCTSYGEKCHKKG